MQINVIQIMEFSQQSTKPVFLRSKYSKIPNKGPSIKDVGIFLAIFYTPLPHVGILTLIFLTSIF